ncbi:MAG TPA: efflux RND transporter periplasmic adaptor subunit [Flavobacteriales bacterium]|nr:efflux RND transporter periplasmic adaptor subunit [Flavobacteriales bacterium]
MNTTKYILAILISFPLFFTSCAGGEEDYATEEHHDEESDMVELTDAQFKVAGIELGNVEMRTISGTIPASGLLDVPPQSKVSISAPMGGFVKSTDLLQGSRVSKGQVVAVMQHQDYIQLQQDYLENFNQLEYLKAEYDRQQELAKENVNAKKSLEQAKANYYSTKGTVDGLKAKLQMLNINVANLEKGEIQNTINLYAPISGYVTKVNTNIGAFVNPTDVLFEIVNTEKLHVELTIFEKDVPLLKVNQRVLFTLANETTHRVAFVHLIGREISSDRSVQVHCEIDKQDRELIPGMYLKAIVETDSAHVAAVPEEAIVNFEGKKYIFIETTEVHEDGEKHDHEKGEKEEEKHHFKMVEVTTGETELGFVSVILPEGFELNTKIVTKGAFSLLAKMKNSEEEEGGHAH